MSEDPVRSESAPATLDSIEDAIEAVVAESRRRELVAIVESSADAVIGWTLDGVVTSWNPRAEQVYGYSAEEMLGRSFAVLTPPAYESELPEILERVRAGDRIEGLEAARMRKDGRRIEVAISAAPIRDERGDVVGVSTISRDISERRAAERRLTEAARHFELIRDLVATCGFDGFFKRLNGAWQATLGYSPEELLARPFIEIVHPLDREAVEDGVQRLAESGSTAQFRVRLSSKGGGWRWTEWSTTPDPRSDLFYCVGRDINERVEAEQALKRERQQLADAQEIASVGSWEFAPATGERTWSAQNFRNHGFEPGAETPHFDALLERIHPEDREKAAELFAELSDIVTAFSYGYRVVRPDGSVREIEAHGRPVVDDGGAKRVIGTTRDVTAERDAERAKDEFFGLVSHELRTPLTSIIGYAELLTEIEAENLSDQGRRFLEVIERNSRRELSLVGDLLLLSKITSGKFEIEVGTADLTAIAESTLEAARPAADKAGLVLSLKAEAGTPLVAGDAHRLTQVVENLVSNAIKFTPNGGRVAVRIARAGKGAMVEVSDTGIGIARDDLGRLFERMYRAPQPQRRHIRGTGLGLTIVKAIVDAHGAAIGVESEPGEGSTFRVVLAASGDHDG